MPFSRMISLFDLVLVAVLANRQLEALAQIENFRQVDSKQPFASPSATMRKTNGMNKEVHKDLTNLRNITESISNTSTIRTLKTHVE